MINIGPIVLIVMALVGYQPSDHNFVYDESIYNVVSSVEEAPIKGMIVPHHTVPMDIIVDMYQRAPDVEHILLISPDHFLNADRHITTSRLDWSGAFGKVYNNHVLTDKLLSMDSVIEDDEEIFIEHGLNTHIPLIAKYFENADVTNLMISKNTNYNELNALVKSLPADLFIIASVDFSHYLTHDQADINDQETYEMLMMRKYDQLFVKSDAYFDSPMCLYVILKYYENSEITIYENQNSADYLGGFYNTTSYFTIGFK